MTQLDQRPAPTQTAPGWQEQTYQLLREHDVSIFGYVPDAGHKTLINNAIADPEVHAVSLTTEEEGIGLVTGAHLGGKRAVLLMQSSGVGNCINLLSLIRHGRFPFLTLVTMRGTFGEGNPWQIAMGQAVRAVLEAMGVIVLAAETEEDAIPAVEAALTMSFKAGSPVAVLLTQRLIGAKEF
jgi:sulfopyruvate decarboxylase alpha subunit